MERGAEVNAWGEDGSTSLIIAARGGHFEVLPLLLYCSMGLLRGRKIVMAIPALDWDRRRGDIAASALLKATEIRTVPGQER